MAHQDISDDEFVRLFLENQPRLYAYIFSLVPHWADADELFQESSIVLWSKRQEFRAGSRFLSWACQIALNKVFDLRKQQARSRLIFDDEFLKSVSDHRLVNAERLQARTAALKVCVEKLKSRDKELLDYRYRFLGTTKEMAQRLGRPLDTVYKALKRIRMQLFHCMDRNMSITKTGTLS